MTKGKKTSFQKKEKATKPTDLPAKNSLFTSRYAWIFAVFFGALAAFLYAPSATYGFVYDDDAVIKDNAYVHAGTAGLGKIWTTSYFMGMDENINARAFRPIPLTSLALEHQWFDKAVAPNESALSHNPNPKIYHLTNILYYAITAAILFFFLSYVLRDYHFMVSLVATLLFVVHPIHLEVVANIKSRDTMFGFIGLISASWMYVRYFDTKQIKALVLATIFFGFGLFSKEEVLTGLAILPLLPYFFRKTSLKEAILPLIPIVLLAFLYLGIRSSIVGGINEGVELTALDNSLLATSGTERISSNLLVLGHYLAKAFFPHPLISDYSYSTIPNVGWDDYRVYLSILAYGGIALLGIWGFKKRHFLGFVALQYAISLSMFTSVIITNVSAYNDRFLYTSSLAVCLAIGWLSVQLPKPWGFQYFDYTHLLDSFRKYYIGWILTLGISGLAIAKINSHLPVWESRYTLFEHDGKLAPNNARMLKNQGGSFVRLAMDVQTSDPEQCKAYARQAISALEKANSIYDGMSTGYVHLGISYTFVGENEKAVKAYERVLESKPNDYFALANVANTLYRMGRYKEGLNYLLKVNPQQLAPNDHYLLAITYDKLGNADKARHHLALSGRDK